MNCYGGDQICHRQVPLTLLVGTLSPQQGHPAPMSVPNNMPGLPVRLGLPGPLPPWAFRSFLANRLTNKSKKQGPS